MVYKTRVLRTLIHVRKMCVNERTLNMRYSIYTFTMRKTQYVKHAFKKRMFYNVRMLHIFLCKGSAFIRTDFIFT